MTLRTVERFYKEVSVGEESGEATVLLDGRMLRTPAKTSLILPTAKLAAAIAEEWRDQDEEIQPFRMPLTRLAVSAVDRVKPAREAVVDQLTAYGGTDLLCYRSDREDLAARQAATWQPLLDWAEEALGAYLVFAEGIMPISQDAGALAALRRALEVHSDMELAALHLITTTTGSLVLAFAVSQDRIDADTAWTTGRLDENWQAERWGEDAEAVERADLMRLELSAAARFLQLCRGS